ncbi:MAG: ornithine--oxo-acid transaminase [Deltaproteobacteria bacterium]|nr:ornithine--oxo-acid transaminase [Deltaproteobacteria bacterium]
MTLTTEIINKTDSIGAHNYKPLPVVLVRGEGVWVWDAEDRKYMDMLSAYSALSQGHGHPKIIDALTAQAKRITLTSRAFHNDQLQQLYERLVKLTGLPRVLPMNTGAEAVETALKAARRWGQRVKGVPAGKQEIIVCTDNFHGRTISIISFSSDAEYQDGFGPLTPGFRIIPYGDAQALEEAITENTVGFLMEPIQGEAGINIPPDGFLREAARICKEHNVLLMMDEIQTGFGRTGKMFCCHHEDVQPDVMILGKALGGGVLPVSAICATEEVMQVFDPGSHGSTFGGNPLGAAVACAAIDVLLEEDLVARSAELGEYLMERLRQLESPYIDHVRGKGLLVGIVLKKEAGNARRYSEALMKAGMLCKETHDHILRMAPPLVITREEIDWAVERLDGVLREGHNLNETK